VDALASKRMDEIEIPAFLPYKAELTKAACRFFFPSLGKGGIGARMH